MKIQDSIFQKKIKRLKIRLEKGVKSRPLAGRNKVLILFSAFKDFVL